MKRILFALPDFERGGIGKSLKNLLDLLENTELEIDVYCGYQHGIYCGELKNCTILPSCHLHKILATKLNACSGFYRIYVILLKFLRHFLLKIFHIELLSLAAWFIARKINTRNYDVAVAFSQDYPSWWIEKSNVKRKFIWIHEVLGSIRADLQCHPNFEFFEKIVCVSNEAKRSFTEFYPEMSQKVICIPNGTNAGDILQKSANKIPDDSLFVKDSFTILSIGRISYIKNFVAIPPIVKKLKERTGKSFRWFIIGNGSALETGHLVSQIKKYGVENEVVLLGEQANPYMFLKHADLFVCTSICESYGIVIDEAKVLGIPCLCTDYPAAYEVLSEEYGRIASIEQFDEIILAMIESPEVLKKYRDNLERYRPDNSEIIKKFITAIYEN